MASGSWSNKGLALNPSGDAPTPERMLGEVNGAQGDGEIAFDSHGLPASYHAIAKDPMVQSVLTPRKREPTRLSELQGSIRAKIESRRSEADDSGFSESDQSTTSEEGDDEDEAYFPSALSDSDSDIEMPAELEVEDKMLQPNLGIHARPKGGSKSTARRVPATAGKKVAGRFGSLQYCNLRADVEEALLGGLDQDDLKSMALATYSDGRFVIPNMPLQRFPIYQCINFRSWKAKSQDLDRMEESIDVELEADLFDEEYPVQDEDDSESAGDQAHMVEDLSWQDKVEIEAEASIRLRMMERARLRAGDSNDTLDEEIETLRQDLDVAENVMVHQTIGEQLDDILAAIRPHEIAPLKASVTAADEGLGSCQHPMEIDLNSEASDVEN